MKTLTKIALLICRDPEHDHNSPYQRMIAFEENNHYVEVTQDGNVFNVLVDGVKARFGLTSKDALQFVIEATS